MSSNKTTETDSSVDEFISAAKNAHRIEDSKALISMMKEITGKEPRMWGSSLVGFGQYHYKYESGREGDFFLTGFSPRKAALTVYIISGFSEYTEKLAQLGPHKTGKSCLYLKNLDTVDREVLGEIIQDSVASMRKKYDCG